MAGLQVHPEIAKKLKGLDLGPRKLDSLAKKTVGQELDNFGLTMRFEDLQRRHHSAEENALQKLNSRLLERQREGQMGFEPYEMEEVKALVIGLIKKYSDARYDKQAKVIQGFIERKKENIKQRRKYL